MFNFFHKKYFLKDYLEGYIDIHNHVLPGIDDGAADVEASVELINRFKSLGISKLIATPHVMNDYYPNTSSSIRQAHHHLQQLLKDKNIQIEIKPAAEYMMDQAFLDLLEREDLLCLKDNMVLVEMSYFQPPINLNEILFKLQTAQYRTVLAHPERYAYFHSKSLNKYSDLKSRGCLFQLNLLSLVGHYGRNMQEIAYRLLEEGMIDFLGTDTHQLRHLEKLSTASFRKKDLELILPVIQNTKKVFAY
ncbi:tyrosine-protein phosphatase [Salinimicrobium oceani]|uniref:protein-tyrosine-phosphatase n=1 Tax=Salinimicrobium oceani TaxID=2722702 RepID=A0ABX1CYS0_9FLAO|nr:CpsB/CapC family capsule biosynthesis tyrosine phosphatase [Salinimicrobium oceani]NJW53412.1 histidinol phosphatase [Salinimicrobium oceani]